jgi:hypothetical protein
LRANGGKRRCKKEKARRCERNAREERRINKARVVCDCQNGRRDNKLDREVPAYGKQTMEWKEHRDVCGSCTDDCLCHSHKWPCRGDFESQFIASRQCQQRTSVIEVCKEVLFGNVSSLWSWPIYVQGDATGGREARFYR